jgi:hypothetical protein
MYLHIRAEDLASPAIRDIPRALEEAGDDEIVPALASRHPEYSAVDVFTPDRRGLFAGEILGKGGANDFFGHGIVFFLEVQR